MAIHCSEQESAPTALGRLGWRCRLSAVCLYVLVFAVLAVGAAGCDLVQVLPEAAAPVNQETGNIKARAVLNTTEMDGYPVKARFTMDGIVTETESVVVGDEISVDSPELFVGTWTVCITIHSPEGRALYSGTSEVAVHPDTASAVSLTLGPAPGWLTVQMDLSDFAHVEGLLKGKLLTNEGAYENFTVSDPLSPVEVTLELPPHDYDFAVALYEDAYYSYNQIYLSPYQHVSIASGQTTSITWSPPTGTLTLELTLDSQPLPPPDVSITSSGNTALISWAASPTADAACYRVYLRWDDYSRYELWEEVPAESELQVEVALDSSPPSEVLSAVVTAVDGSGNESMRSEEAVMAL